MHPYQHTYYNLLHSYWDDKENIFELDYWGLSNKEALEFLSKVPLPPHGKLRVLTEADSTLINLRMIEKKQRDRFEIIELHKIPHTISLKKSPCLLEFTRHYAWKYEFIGPSTLKILGAIWTIEEEELLKCLKGVEKNLFIEYVRRHLILLQQKRDLLFYRGDYLVQNERSYQRSDYKYKVVKKIKRDDKLIMQVFKLRN